MDTSFVRNDEKFVLAGPWPMTYKLRSVRCRICDGDVAVQESVGAGSVAWLRSSEQMLEGDDYVVVGRRGGAKRLDGQSPVTVAWLWHPMPRDETWNAKVEDQVRQDDAMHDQRCARLLVLPPDFDPGRWTAMVRDLAVTEVWHLKRHVMDGAAGPYPSLRAGNSIRKSTVVANAWNLRYYWPSVGLPMSGYMPLADSNSMAMAWSAYSRLNFEIGFPTRTPESTT